MVPAESDIDRVVMVAHMQRHRWRQPLTATKTDGAMDSKQVVVHV